MSKIRALLVEDSEIDARVIAHEVRDVATVDVAQDKATFLEKIEQPFDVVLVDLDLVNWKGVEAIKTLKDRYPKIPVVIVTGSVSRRQADEACRHGARRFFTKEIDGVPGLARAIVDEHETAKTKAEAEELKRQAIRDQRLEQLGDLSAGIVHDFNNVLAVVVMGGDRLRERINPMDERVLDAMMSAAKRGAEMTAQVLAFARGSNGAVFRAVSTEYLLTEVGRFVRTTFPPTIHVTWETVPGTCSVRGDVTQLLQVLTNLATNARDAMPKGGSLRFKAQGVAHVPGLSGPCVVITVSDTGSGIPDDALEKCWEPFFTTKEPGRGTGLGLPTVKRIIEAHHGIVKIITDGSGTSFHVYLPVATSEIKAQDKVLPESLHGGGRVILLVDDMTSVREMAALILEEAGYHVISCVNAPEAMSHFRAGKAVDAVVTDETMPVLSGSEMIRNLRAQGFNPPFILMSGHDASTPTDVQVSARIQKPVGRDILLETLARVLTSPVPAA